jgi:hypothetical protein
VTRSVSLYSGRAHWNSDPNVRATLNTFSCRDLREAKSLKGSMGTNSAVFRVHQAEAPAAESIHGTG